MLAAAMIRHEGWLLCGLVGGWVGVGVGVLNERGCA